MECDRGGMGCWKDLVHDGGTFEQVVLFWVGRGRERESSRVRMSAKYPLPNPHLISVMIPQMSGETETEGFEGRLKE